MIDGYAVLQQFITYFCILMLMIGLGTNVELDEITTRLKAPTGILIALFAQFILLPLIGFTLGEVFPIDEEYAIGLKIISMCPGGTASNIMCYYSLADVPLSISCTTCSTLASLVMMPLWLSIFIPNSEGISINKALPDLFGSIIVITCGTLIGAWIQGNHKKWAHRFEILGAFLGCIFVVLAVVSSFQADIDLWTPNDTFYVYISCILLTFFGLTFGFSAASVGGWIHPSLKLRKPERIAVALETSVQNKILALLFIYMVYEGDARAKAAIVPVIYTFFASIQNGVFMLLAYHLGWTYGDPKKYYIENFKSVRNIRRAYVGQSPEREIEGEEQQQEQDETRENQSRINRLENQSRSSKSIEDESRPSEEIKLPSAHEGPIELSVIEEKDSNNISESEINVLDVEFAV